jgi:hypothetical protein
MYILSALTFQQTKFCPHSVFTYFVWSPIQHLSIRFCSIFMFVCTRLKLNIDYYFRKYHTTKYQKTLVIDADFYAFFNDAVCLTIYRCVASNKIND